MVRVKSDGGLTIVKRKLKPQIAEVVEKVVPRKVAYKSNLKEAVAKGKDNEVNGEL